MIKQVMIGSKRYDVHQKSIVVDGEQVGAKFDGVTSTIIVAPTLAEGAKPHALIYEVICSILFEEGYMYEMGNEKLVNDLAQQIILLIRQNPHLIRYIQDTGTVDQATVDSQSELDATLPMMDGDEDD